MAGKDAVLKMLREALDSEEKVVPIYNKHLESALFWTGLPAPAAEKAKTILNRLIDDSLGHKEAVLTLIKRIEAEA